MGKEFKGFKEFKEFKEGGGRRKIATKSVRCVIRTPQSGDVESCFFTTATP